MEKQRYWVIVDAGIWGCGGDYLRADLTTPAGTEKFVRECVEHVYDDNEDGEPTPTNIRWEERTPPESDLDDDEPDGEKRFFAILHPSDAVDITITTYLQTA